MTQKLKITYCIALLCSTLLTFSNFFHSKNEKSQINSKESVFIQYELNDYVVRIDRKVPSQKTLNAKQIMKPRTKLLALPESITQRIFLLDNILH